MGHEQHGWLPYCGPAVTPSNWLMSWNLDPILLLALLFWSALFLRMRTSSNAPDRRARSNAGIAAALAMVALYVTPFCPLGSTFFAARVVHHMLLVLLVAPLVAVALAPLLARVSGSLALWTALATVVFWFWHAPQAYAWALSSDAIFWAMQLTILASAALFWERVRSAEPVYALSALLVATVQMGLLGALITFAATPLYAPHVQTVQAWGWTPMQDQQYAGILMWAPGCFGYLFAAMIVGWRWLNGETVRMTSTVRRTSP